MDEMHTKLLVIAHTKWGQKRYNEVWEYFNALKSMDSDYALYKSKYYTESLIDALMGIKQDE